MKAVHSFRNWTRNILLAIPLLSHCAASHAGIATSNIPINFQKQEIQYIATDTVTTDWWVYDMGIFGLPLGDPPVDEALQTLLSRHQGDALVNIRYYTQRYVFLFLSRYSLTVKADVVKIVPRTIPQEQKETKDPVRRRQ